MFELSSFFWLKLVLSYYWCVDFLIPSVYWWHLLTEDEDRRSVGRIVRRTLFTRGRRQSVVGGQSRGGHGHGLVDTQ